MITKQQVPNLLTYARVLAVPLTLGVLLYAPAAHQLLFWIFAIACATDFLDGYLARKWNATSDIGALLDPVADKLLVALLLIYLPLHTDVPFLAVAVIILREIYISGLREFLALRNHTLPVSKGGKLKTTLQMLSIALLLFAMAYGVPHAWMVGKMLLWAAALVALVTAYDYTSKALPKLR